MQRQWVLRVSANHSQLVPHKPTSGYLKNVGTQRKSRVPLSLQRWRDQKRLSGGLTLPMSSMDRSGLNCVERFIGGIWWGRSESNRHLRLFRPALRPHQLHPRWWPRSESNRLRADFQSAALPMSYKAMGIRDSRC